MLRKIKTPQLYRVLLLLVLLLLLVVGLTGCHEEDEIDFRAPTISIDSPLPGSDVTSLSVLVSGTVSSDTVRVELTVDGTTVTATLVGTAFSGIVNLQPGSNSVKALARDAVGNRNTVTFNLQYPQLTLADGAAASLVIGQIDFNTNLPNQGSIIAANTLSGLRANLHERGYTTLYLPDSGNNRILGFNAIPSVSNASASFVLGQGSFTTAETGVTATQFSMPMGVYSTSTQLFLADAGNNRVLIWDSLPTSNSVGASHVIGQADLTSNSANCSATTLSNPVSVFVVNNKVVVLDKDNNRVLIWNSIPASDGVAADVVVGQVGVSAMDTCNANDSDGNGVTDTLSASTLNNPGGLWTDGARLLVADTGNNRVLVWDSFPAISGEPADWVIGQVDMMSAATALNATSLNTPRSVTSNGNQIVIADSGNARVLIYNSFPSADGMSASNVIGQPDFTTTGTGISDIQMDSYDSVYVDRTRLFVVDGNRILIFSNPVL